MPVDIPSPRTNTCQQCGNIFTHDAVIAAGGLIFCGSSCAIRHGNRQCSICCRWIRLQNSRSYYNRYYCCAECENADYRSCVNCGSRINIYDAIEISDNFYCNHDCANEDGYELYSECNEYCGNGRRCDCPTRQMDIESYSYKPNPIFYNLKQDKPQLYMGVELEVCRNNLEDFKAPERIKEYDLFYCKEDGSINPSGGLGFEIVTHPFTMDWFKVNEYYFDEVFKLAKKGWTSYDANKIGISCGMHVHVNTNYLTAPELMLLMKFIYDNPDLFYKISRRKVCDIDQWASLKKPDQKGGLMLIAKNKHQNVKYQALRVTSRTVEFRLFRGTLKREAFIANLECVHAVIHFVKQFTSSNIKEMTVNNFLGYAKQYNYFYNCLIENRIKQGDK